MHPTQVCIVARPMSRRSDRALPAILVIAVTCIAMMSGLGCEELDGRNRTRSGNRMFRETKFVDAVAEYEKALKTVDDPIIHYNLGLAYSKVFKPGVEKPTRLGIKGTFVCDVVPNTKTVSASVCVKEDDRRYDDCDAKNVCASSYECKQVDLCTLDGEKAAEAAATHFQGWLKANPKDDDTRKQMTQVWLDSGQYKLAIEYWTGLLAAKPNDSEIMGNLAGINLKSGDWRTSIDWYLKVADVAVNPDNKVSAYQFIGNVAWSKLNSKTLTQPEVLELADKGIGALQRAAEINPKNPKLFGLQGSIFNFRALAQGASWAAALDRASAQDLQRTSRVLAEEAKKAQGAAMPTPTNPSPMSGGPAEKAGG
jgi:tetratricopeptide (TPR) repeat protein